MNTRNLVSARIVGASAASLIMLVGGMTAFAQNTTTGTNTLAPGQTSTSQPVTCTNNTNGGYTCMGGPAPTGMTPGSTTVAGLNNPGVPNTGATTTVGTGANTGTPGTGTNTGSGTNTPGVPNTGAGGEGAMNLLFLAISGTLAAVAAVIAHRKLALKR